jgi:putative flippase GtrA
MLDVSRPTVDPRRRITAYLLVGVLVVVLNALSFRTLDQPLWVGAAVGLAWTLLAIPVAAWVNRRRARLGHWPDTVALLAAANAAIVVGFGLLLDLTFPDAASYLAMNQTAAGPNHSFAYGLVNTPREWLLVPLAVLVNWHLPRRRRLLLWAVAVLYLERVVTYLYFAPTVLSWQDTVPAETTPGLLDEVSRWMTLDLARTPVDWLLLAVLMIVVVAHPLMGAWDRHAPAGTTVADRALLGPGRR